MIFGKIGIKSENSGEEFVIRFTDKVEEQNRSFDEPIYVLYISEKVKEERNPLAEGVLKALSKNDNSFEIINSRVNEKYYITYVEALDEIMKHNYHKKKVIDFTIITPPPIVYVYSYASTCKKCERNNLDSDLETVVAKVKAINANSSDIVDCLLKVTHCIKCDTYFINALDLKKYEKRYQAILIKKDYEYADESEEDYNYYYYELNNYSILSSYGYKADGSQNSDCRHQIIDFIVSIDKQYAYKIKNHLNYLINTRKNMIEAQARWLEDYRYVQRIINPTRYIGEAILQ